MIDRDALKAMLDAQSKALLESPEYVAAIGDALHGGAGIGVVRISADGQMERIKPRDFFIDQKACPECGSDQWMHEMGGSIELRHFRGCSQWHSYFDGGVPTTEALEGKK